MIWCLSRVFVRAGSARQRYSVLGTVETRDHDLVTVRTPGSVNAQSVCQLIERVWRLVKTKTLRNRYFPDFASFTFSIDSFIDSLASENRHLLKSLVTHNFQAFGFPKIR